MEEFLDLSFIGWLAFLLFAIIVVAKSIRVVPQQTAMVVERLGKYLETMTGGLQFLIPFVDRVAYIHTLKEVPMDVKPQVCITRDNTQVEIDGVIYYQVTDPQRASYGTANFVLAIEQLAKTTLRSEVGKRELDKLLEERSEINLAVVNSLDEAAPNWGVKVLRYEIRDITPPESVLRAMQLQITAEREKRAKIAQSEGTRQQEINLADGAKQAAIARSEGDKQAAINKAQGEAAAITAVAEATAGAIRQIAAAIGADGGKDAVQLKVAERYVDAFSQIAKSTNTVVVPGNMGDMAGMIATAMGIMKGPDGAPALPAPKSPKGGAGIPTV